MDDLLLELQTKLDEAKAKGNINADIEKIQSQINKLKIQVEIDPKSISDITKQMSKLGIQIGQDFGKAFNNGLSSTINTNILNNLNKISDSSTSTIIQNEKKKQEAYKATSDAVVYHAGVISKLNKAETNGRFYGSSRGTGYFGTCHYFVDSNTKHELDNNSTYSKLPYTSVDISKYDNLFKATTDEIASKLHNFLENLTRFTQGSDRFNIDELFSQFKNVFTDTTMNIKDFGDKMEQLKTFMSNSNLSDRSDSVSTQFMKSLGYGGVDTRGTKYADTRYGTVIYDLKEESVLQANITDELQKQGQMLEKINYEKGQVFDSSADAKIQEQIDAQIRLAEVQAEFKKSFSTTNLDKSDSELTSAKNRLSEINDIISNCQHSIENATVESQKFAKEMKSLGINMTDSEIAEHAKESTISYKQRIEELSLERAELEKRIPILEENYNKESQLASEAYKQAEQIVEQRRLEAQQSSSTANEVIQNEEKKQHATQESIKLQSELASFATKKQIDKIQLSLETGGYESKVDALITKTQQWTDRNGEARISTTALSTALDNLNKASITLSNNNTVENQRALITAEKELDTQIKTVTNSVRSMNAELAKDSVVSSLHNKVADFISKNGKTVKYYGTELNRIFTETAQGASLTDAQVRQLNQDFNNTVIAARNAGKLGKTFFQTLKDGMSSFSYWTSSTFLVMKTIQSVKGGIKSIIELDTALVDLRKTTTMTYGELEKFYYEANEVAKQMGVTTAEIINQASAWSRLGYSSADAASKMAKYSSMFASISPGMNVDKATDGLVSVMKAFDIGNDNPDDVLDGIMSKINIIGNTAATSNAEIVNMLTKSSSAMKEANNTLEETIALETAAVEITRDDDSVGTAFKTVAMRIRGYDEETEEFIGNVEELSGKIANLTKTASTPGGISLFTDESKTEYKSTYQLLKEISEIYDQLTDKDQAGLLEALAGKRQGQIIAATINNFEAAEKAMNNMANSAGSAEAEMSVIMDSLDYKLNQLSETGTGIAQNLFKKDDMKSVIDILNSFMGVLDKVTEKLGLFGSLITGGTLFAGLKNVGMA